MAHRVKQILDAAAAACSSNTSLRAVVEVNRVRSLAEEQAELPALTVNYGADTPEDSDQESFRSAIELLFTSYVAGDSETEVLDALLEMRRQVHISLMADISFGLSFVWDIAYGGADAPVLQQGERMYGAQTCRWNSRYVLEFADAQ